MLGAIYVGLSGMNAFSRGLQTISNNVANMNSPGYKASSVSFADVFNIGGLGSSYSGHNGRSTGAGVRFGAPGIDFSQGDMRQSGGGLDLAVQGNGFMVLSDGDRTSYARTGQFAVDDDGYISLLGTTYHLNVLNSSGQATPLNLDALRTSPPTATTRIEFSQNIDASAAEVVVSDIAVYDSRGGRQVWTATLTRPDVAAPGEWTVTVRDQSGATVGASTLRFIGGILDPATSTITITDEPDDADALLVVLDFSSGVTSFSGSGSPLRKQSVDGNSLGALTAVKVNAEGHVELTYSNGKVEDMGAVALADFRDVQQLERAGDGLFNNRGGTEARLLASKADGMGTLVAGQLEASNVDLAQQFGDLILIQRGFQASSQVVSISNDMIQQLFGIRGQG